MKVRQHTKQAIFLLLLIVLAFFLLREFFINEITPFTVEILAAVIGSLVIVTSMSMMMRLQSDHDVAKESSNRVFTVKLKIYKDLLRLIFEADDDGVLSKKEILDIENTIGIACLVANESLVRLFSQFTCQLKNYGAMYFRSMNPQQQRHFMAFIGREKIFHKIHTPFINRHKSTSNGGESDAETLKRIFPSGIDPDTDKLDKVFVSLDDLIQGIRTDLDVVPGDIHYLIEAFSERKYDNAKLIQTPSRIN